MLIKNAAAILTGLPGAAARAPGPDVRVSGTDITEVGRLAPQPGEQLLDATGCVVYPGWVNTHHHLFQSMLKGIPAAIDQPLFQWLERVPYRYRPLFDEALLRLAAEIGIAELVLSGCTTIADHHYLYYPGIPFDGGRILFETAERFGVRFVLCRGGQVKKREFEQNLPDELRPETIDGFFADVERLAKAYNDPGPASMRRVVMAPTTPTWAMEPGDLREFARFGRKLGLRLHTHLSETRDYVTFCREVHGTTPVEFVGRHEWLGPDVWFAHMVHATEPEIRIMGETGTGVAHCPASNCRLGSGIAPIPEYAAAGAPVSVGVDGAASNEAADMISEAHLAWFIHRARLGAGAAKVEDVVHWCSRGGAKVLGFDRVGAVAPGYAADLAVYDLRDPRYAGLHDEAVGPVACAGRPHLKYLVSNGKVVVEDDAIPGFDLADLRRRARAAVQRLVQAVR